MATSTIYSAEELRTMSIHAIARIIGADWKRVREEGTPGPFGNMGQNPANPYWDAMKQLELITQYYGSDSGVEIVSKFLGNAGSWRGPQAKLVKAELKARVKAARGY